MARKPKTEVPMILTFHSTDNMQIGVRSFADNRFIINRTIVTYKGTDGYDYCKAFESRGEPTVPLSGTHETLNGLKTQYK